MVGLTKGTKMLSEDEKKRIGSMIVTLSEVGGPSEAWKKRKKRVEEFMDTPVNYLPQCQYCGKPIFKDTGFVEVKKCDGGRPIKGGGINIFVSSHFKCDPQPRTDSWWRNSSSLQGTIGIRRVILDFIGKTFCTDDLLEDWLSKLTVRSNPVISLKSRYTFPVI